MFAGKNHNRVGRSIQVLECRIPGIWVGGGAFRSFVGNETLNDIDIFCESDERHEEWCEHMVRIGALRDANFPDQVFNFKGYRYDHSVTKRLPNSNSFVEWADFTCVAGVIDLQMRVTTHKNHVSDILNKELKFWKGWTPIQGLERTFKLLDRGYKPIHKDQFFKELYTRIQTQPIEMFC